MCIRDSPTALHHQPDRVRLELPAELPPLAHANTLSPFHGLLQVSTLSRQVQDAKVARQTDSTSKGRVAAPGLGIGSEDRSQVLEKSGGGLGQGRLYVFGKVDLPVLLGLQGSGLEVVQEALEYRKEIPVGQTPEELLFDLPLE